MHEIDRVETNHHHSNCDFVCLCCLLLSVYKLTILFFRLPNDQPNELLKMIIH